MTPELKVQYVCSRRDDSAIGFTIIAVEGGRLLGYYGLEFSRGLHLVHGEIITYRRGFARGLIESAARELESFSVERQRNFIHQVVLNTNRSRLVLPHIYKELDYQQTPNVPESDIIRLYRGYISG